MQSVFISKAGFVLGGQAELNPPHPIPPYTKQRRTTFLKTELRSRIINSEDHDKIKKNNIVFSETPMNIIFKSINLKFNLS